MTIDERLAKHFGLCWHEWRGQYDHPQDLDVRYYQCQKCGEIHRPYPLTRPTTPDFTAQIVVDGEPVSLLVHHLKLKGELEGFLEWLKKRYTVHTGHPQIDPSIFDAVRYSQTLLTPTLLRQAVGAYLDWKEASK